MTGNKTGRVLTMTASWRDARQTTAVDDAREEMPRWRLEELLPASEEAGDEAVRLERALAEVERLTANLEQARDRLDCANAIDVLALLDAYELLHIAASRVGSYAGLRFAEDTQSTAALKLRTQVEEKLTDCQNRALFFELWWQQLPEDRAADLLQAAQELSASPDSVFFLTDLRRTARFRLEESAEQIINLKDADGSNALLTVYSMISNGFKFTPNIEGAGAELSRDQLMRFAFSTDAAHREEAYRELYRVYASQRKVLGQLYVHRVRDWRNEQMRLRGHRSPIAVRNVANDIADQAVEALLRATREAAGLFQRYFRWKAGALGLERLRRFDLYAPLNGGTSEDISFSRAEQLVRNVFSGFDPAFGVAAGQVFDAGHIDAPPRPGKKGGAFCATVEPRLLPWVLVNYAGKPRDVATLAHEMGHAVHSVLAANHSALTQHPSLPLAETASVFAELLVSERLLGQTSNAAGRRELLAAQVDDFYATIVRQGFFVLFEQAAHEAVAHGASIDELDEIYWGLLQEQFGDAVVLDRCFAREWIAIPHLFSTPFYCYAYAFGQLLVLALFARYREQGEAFRQGYLDMLSLGGSKRPVDLLAAVGVDAADEAFWRGGFALVEERILALEE